MVVGPWRWLLGWRVLTVVAAERALQLPRLRFLSQSLSCVDLRSLQAVGIVDVDRFPRGIKIERAGAAFAMPVAGLLHSAKGQMHFSSNGRRVDISDAGFHVPHHLQRQVYVARIQCREKPLLDAIRNPYRLGETF